MKWSQRSIFSFTADEEKYKSFTFESICLNTCLYTHTFLCTHRTSSTLCRFDTKATQRGSLDRFMQTVFTWYFDKWKLHITTQLNRLITFMYIRRIFFFTFYKM